MPTVANKPDTRERILDIAQDLLQTRGYNAFSYQDIADALGIKKASLHYHFPSKTDLVAALATRHADTARDYLAGVDESLSAPWAKLDAFIKPFAELARTCNRMCMGGMLAADFLTLDPSTQQQMRGFFRITHEWLAALLDKGRSSGDFAYKGSPKAKADVIIATLEGVILLARMRQDAAFLNAVIKDIKASLGG